MVCLNSFVCSFGWVAFSGSRHAFGGAYSSCSAFLPLLANYSGVVGVGCASGIDAAVRSSFSAALIFKVQPPLNRGAFAKRSQRMVNWLAAKNGLLIAFPSTACPLQVQPSSTFAGYGSGTWGSIALALGLGAAVLLVLSKGTALNAPPAVASCFKCVGVAPCGGSLYLSNVAPQGATFLDF
jgi:hypothetical protein